MKQVIKDASLFTVPKSDVRGKEVVLWRLRQKTGWCIMSCTRTAL